MEIIHSKNYQHLPTLLLPTCNALLSNTNDTSVKYKDAIEAMNEELNNIIERNNNNNKENDSLQATLVPLTSLTFKTNSTSRKNTHTNS
jgi:hypothetical protein